MSEPNHVRDYVNELNYFVTRFDTHNFEKEHATLRSLLSSRDDRHTSISLDDACLPLKRVKVGKVCDPDMVSSRVLK